MIRMVIADDEYIIRDGLVNIFPWKAHGIEIVGVAQDGKQAYDLCKELRPDILFTDIRMPVMDGLEVAYRLREEKQPIKLIIISGIQDFYYAKTAIDLGVEGFVLKPIKLPELEIVVSNVVKKIKKESKQQSTMTDLQYQMQAGLPLLQEMFLRSLIYIRPPDADVVLEKLTFLELPLEVYRPYCVCVMQINDYKTYLDGTFRQDKELLRFGVLNMLNEFLGHHHTGTAFLNMDNEFILIFQSQKLDSIVLMEILQLIHTFFIHHFSVEVSIGVGSIAPSLLQLRDSYNHGKIALQHRFVTTSDFYVEYQSLVDSGRIQSLPSVSPVTPILDEMQEQLIDAVKRGNTQATLETLNSMFIEIISVHSTNTDYIQTFFIELIFTLSHTLAEFDENMGEIIDTNTEIIQTIQSMDTILDLQKYLEKILTQVALFFGEKYSGKNQKVVDTIKEIIQNRYMQPLSILTIAEEIYLTPNYISMIFKQETGGTLTEYLTALRIEQAKHLLKESDDKILYIAEHVGFDSASYFSTVFKKQVGVTPQQFRALSR